MKTDDLTTGDNEKKVLRFNPNYLLVILILCIAIFFLTQSQFLKKPESAVVPIAISIFSIALSVFLAIKTYLGKCDREKFDFSRIKQVAIVLLLLCGYVFVMTIVGYYIATFIFCYITMTYLQYESVKNKLIISIVLPICVFLVFELVFDIKIPHGMIFETFL